MDAQDRMTHYGTCVYAYGANGERVQKTDTASGHITAYQYDEFGNLRQANLPDGRTISYGIDGLNRRVTKFIDGQLQGSWLYKDALEPIAELDAAGNFVSLFAYGEKPHVPSLMRKGSTAYKIVSDHLGSVRQVINLSTGAVVQALDYDAWGNVLQDTNPGFQPFGFAGGLYDRDTGLVRFGARDYDPVSGRWTAKDPIGFGGRHPNLYTYASADPINRIDANGLQVTINLLAPDSPEYGFAQNYQGPSDEISISAHGDRNGVWDRRGKKRVLNADALRELILDHPSYSPEKPIRLLNCRSAEGQNSLAEQLAESLPNDVLGSEGKMQMSSDGSVQPFLDLNQNGAWDGSESATIFTVFPGSR